MIPTIFPPPVVPHDNGHGRIETRRVQTTMLLNDYLHWPSLQQVIRVERETLILATGHRRHEVVFALTDLAPAHADPATLGALIRGHWAIENRLHWVRDWAWDEDRSTVRTGAGPQVMATLRNTALGLLRRQGLSAITRALAHLGRHPERVATLLGCPSA